jgi:hypothetical protein
MRASCLITIRYPLVAATALPAQADISGDDDGVFALIHDSHVDRSDPMDIRDVGSRGGLTFKRRSRT